MRPLFLASLMLCLAGGAWANPDQTPPETNKPCKHPHTGELIQSGQTITIDGESKKCENGSFK